MRKFLFVLLMGTFLIGCSNDKPKDEYKSEDATEKVSGSEEDEIEVDLDKRLGVSIDDVTNLSFFNDEDDTKIRTYTTKDGDTVDALSTHNDTVRVFAYYYDDNQFASEVVVRIPNGSSLVDDVMEMVQELWKSLDDEVIEFSDVEFADVDEDDKFDYGGIIFNNNHELESLPIHYSEIANNDFFLEESNVDFFEDSLGKAEYEKIHKKASEYIEEHNPSEYDSVYEILDIIEPVQKYLEKVDVQYDDFDEESTIYYKGLTDISNNNYIVPFITTGDKDFSLLVGFEKDGWLFSDKLTFNIDGERESFGSFDPDRDTIGGSMIREEYTKTSYDEELIENIINGKEVKMRFEGDKGNLDYTLTDDDINAIKVIKDFNGINHDLSNLIYRFNN